MNSIFSNTLKGINDGGGSNTAALLQELQRQQNLAYAPQFSNRTVFTDIGDELGKCSNEEKKFIEGNAAYQEANMIYMQNFNAFLLEMVGPQFIASKYGPSAEKLLKAIKDARAAYQAQTSQDFAKVKDENAALRQELKELNDKIDKLHSQGLIG